LRDFRYYHPTKITFGNGKISEVGAVTLPYGKNVMLVIDPAMPEYQPEAVKTVKNSLKEASLDMVVYNRIQPNPILADVQAGAEIARQMGVEAIIGFGGGSSMDTARAIAVAATHEGTAMDYLYFSKSQPTEKTLPVIQIPSTSGTGSHVTCCAVITDSERKFKSALWNREHLFAQEAIVDPELMLSVPQKVTASTGFDVFTHAFESYINTTASPFTDLLAMESIKLVIEHLPRIVEDGQNLESRGKMAWADTLAGICISNAGTTLPHAMGQPISGHYPQVSHGQSLAVIYPVFLDYTAEASIEKFSAVAHIFNSDLEDLSNAEAAASLKNEVVTFLKQIDLYYTLDDLGITTEGIDAILEHCMEFPDIKVNPKVPDTETTRELYIKSFKNP